MKKIQQLHVELIAVKAGKAEMYAFKKRYVQRALEKKKRNIHCRRAVKMEMMTWKT